MSRPSDMRDLTLPVRGRIAECFVRPGEAVARGQALVRLEDDVQLRTIELARIRAENTSGVAAAERALEYRTREYEVMQDSASRGGGSSAELRDAKFRLDAAQIDLDSAKSRSLEDKAALGREEARLNEMRVVSPIAGAVLEVHRRAGEAADEQTPVVTVVSIDPLWLDVSVPMRRALDIGVGDPASVDWQDIDGAQPMEGAVIFRSPSGHAGARELLIRVEVPNPDHLPSGMHGDVTFASTSP